MSRPELLSQEEINVNLKKHPHWELDGDIIVREIVRPNFPAVVGAVNAIAVLAEAMNHHPDILIYGWNKMRISLKTHDKGGLTKLDFELAEKIESLKF